MFAYVGTYTKSRSGEQSKGIYVYRYDPSSGALEHSQTVEGVRDPSFLALHPNGRLLYAVNESAESETEKRGGVSVFTVEPGTGHLTPLNRRPSGGEAPCHVSVHPTGMHVFVANYTSGHVTVLPVRSDGTLGAATHVLAHQGVGPTPNRQAGPHAHFITPDPEGRFILSCDLGIDKVMVYRLDPAAGLLEPNTIPYGQVSSGAGPRHIAFHASGGFLFVNNEIDSTVSAFRYDGERGALAIVDTQPTLPRDFTGRNSTAQIAAHPNGRFLYVSNRGHDSIAIFEIDPETGRLTVVGHEPTRGQTPRNFNLDPSGQFLLAANQGSGTIVTFRVDGETGRLEATGHVTKVPAPVCIIFGDEA